MKELPGVAADADYKSLTSEQQQIISGAMPFVYLGESDGGGDRTFNHVQNMMADFALFAACNCDKFIRYRCAAGHSYTNTAEQGQAILNLGCANHTTVLDPNAPDFLINDVLYNASTMKEVRESVGQYDAELQQAIEWIERVRGNDAATIENNVSPPTGVAESNAGSNSPGDPEPTVDVGGDVKKFFSDMG